jgi:type I restriction enzyme S subunit
LTTWPSARLGDHLRVKHGFAFQGEYFSDAGNYVVLTPGNFIEAGGFKPKSGAEKYFAAEPPPDYVLRRGDLVIAMTEQAQGLLGSSALIPADGVYLHNQRIGLIQPTSGQADLGFLYYLFNTPAVREQIQATATGSKVRHTAPSRVEDVTVPFPPVETQRNIAAILSGYDDLIENNNRRIKLLEEMAQRIYREWLVEFRYPGHESVSPVESDLGLIPDGWTVSALSSLAETIARGVSPRYAEESDQLVINQKCIRGGRLDMSLARMHETTVPPGKMVRDGDVLINSTGVGTLGRVAQVLSVVERVTVDSHVTLVRPAADVADTEFIGLTLLARAPELATMGVGSTGQTELSRSAIGEIKVATPPKQLQSDFAAAVYALRRLPISLAAITRNLCSTRDLLLPRLISGEIDVTDLDIDLSGVAA